MSARISLPSGLVTFLFTDIEGSTRLAQMLGRGYRPVLNEHRRLLRRSLTAAHGAELFTEGDSFFVAFDDAAAALEACRTAQRALLDHAWPRPEATPRVRMGLHTGRAEPVGGEYASPEVHRAARIAAAAHGGQVLCSAATARHADPLPAHASLLDLGLHRLRGFDGRERLFQLVAPGLERRFPRPRTAATASHNLPGQVSRFVGRSAERQELGALVGAHRLVTVVGPAGGGKTRLAVELAGELTESYPDGVWFVDLAAVAEPREVAAAVAAVLGLRPEPGRPVLETLVEYAAGRRLLLLLDTCDARLPAAVEVASRLLTGGPAARVLVTSREPLGLPGEVVWRIPPLSLRPGPAGDPGDAVRLLLERSAAARGGRPPGPEEAARLSQVATRLDGLPLALELAAARLRVLSAAQLAERLDDLLGTLDAGRPRESDPAGGGPVRRHTSLAAAVSWSYRGLPPRAARLLRWLAAFRGPVDLAAVEWLLAEDPLDPLAVLVDKSLVQVESTQAGNTYRMLDPIRAYAARRLTEAGEEATVRDRHVTWALHALQRAGLGTDGRPATLSLHVLDGLIEELRGALCWTASGGSARLGLQLVGGLDDWWRERGRAREARDWLFQLYARIATTGEPISEAELAAAYEAHARHAGAIGQAAEEQRFLRRAETCARQAGDPGLLVRVVTGRAGALVRAGRLAEAEQACRRVVGWAAARGVAGDALAAVCRLAELLWLRGELDEAAELLGAARPVEAARPAERGRRGIDALLGMVALVRRDLVAAHEHLVVALRSRVSYGFHALAAESISALAVRCELGGDPSRAALLFGAAQAARTALGAPAGPYRAFWAAHQAAARAAAGDAAFDAAYARGGELTLAAAAAAALAVEHPDLAVGSRRFSDVDSRAS